MINALITIAIVEKIDLIVPLFKVISVICVIRGF